MSCSVLGQFPCAQADLLLSSVPALQRLEVCISVDASLVDCGLASFMQGINACILLGASLRSHEGLNSCIVNISVCQPG